MRPYKILFRDFSSVSWLTKYGILNPAPGWDRRGRALRTPSGPRGSSGKEVSLGAAGKPVRTHFFLTRERMQSPHTPPVCNYEGSDYQTSFWEKGGRAYEDGCEAVALKRLLPAKVGSTPAGTGRGRRAQHAALPGLRGITLLDYSHTQLEQARATAWATTPAYRYVAADIYRLPFVDGVFDGATMIRTLHHMADAPRALGQVRRVLQPQCHLHPGIRQQAQHQIHPALLAGRQKWSPFTPRAGGVHSAQL